MGKANFIIGAIINFIIVFALGYNWPATNNFLYNFFTLNTSIIAALVLFVALLLIYCNRLKKSTEREKQYLTEESLREMYINEKLRNDALKDQIKTLKNTPKY